MKITPSIVSISTASLCLAIVAVWPCHAQQANNGNTPRTPMTGQIAPKRFDASDVQRLLALHNSRAIQRGSVRALKVEAPVVSAPWLSSISPSVVNPGSAGFTLTVSGSNFLPGAVLMWNNSPLSTIFVSNTSLNASVTADLIAAPGIASVFVLNPLPNNIASANLSVSIGPNPVPSILGLFPSTLPVGSGDTVLYLFGSGFTDQSAVTWNGRNLPTTFYDTTFISALVSEDLLEKPGAARFSVFTPSPGGGSLAPQLFPITIPLLVNDLAYDAHSGMIIATVPGSAGTTGNSLRLIDPVTGHVGSAQFIGSEPSRVVVADDGQFGYTALSGSPAVKRFNLRTLITDLNFFLGPAQSFGQSVGPNYARDIAVVPGNPDSLAVSFKSLEVSPSSVGLGIFDNGVPLTNELAFNGGALAFGGSPSELFGYDNEWQVFSKYAVDSAGVSLIHTDPNQNFSTSANRIVYQSGRLYGEDGRVIDTGTESLLGSYQLPAGSFRFDSVAPDSSAGITYMLSEGQNFNAQVTAYDQSTFQAVINASLTGITLPQFINFDHSLLGSLIRWGFDGLAFHDIGGQVYLIRARAFLPKGNPAPIADLITPSFAATWSPAITIDIQGSDFLSGAVLHWNGSPQPTTVVSSVELQATISASEFRSPGIATITISNPAPAAGLSGPLFFTVGGNPVPHISGISPTEVQANGTSFTISVRGRNFVPGSIIALNGSPLPTLFDGHSHLHALAAFGVTTSGLNAVTVMNPGPGGGTSNTQSLEADLFNTVPRVFGISPESTAVGTNGLTVSISGYNFAPQSTAWWNHTSLATSYVSPYKLNVDIPPALLTKLGSGQISVSNPAPGGGSSAQILFPVYLPLTYANDVVYDPYTRLMYMAMSGNFPGGQSLLIVDPITGEQSIPIPMPSYPATLALSDDGQFIYIGLDSQIARYNISKKSVDFQFSTPNCSPFSLAVMPGHPHTIAAACNGVAAIYDDGLQRPQTFTTLTGILAFHSSSELFVNSLGSTSNIFRLEVNASGLTTSATGSGTFSPPYTLGLATAFGEVITPAGQVIDPQKLNILGFLRPPAPDVIINVVPDPGLGRVFGAASGNFFHFSTAYAFDPHHYQPIASLSIPGPFGTVGVLPPMIRWGRAGIAFQSAPGFGGQPRLYSIESASFVLPPVTSDELLPKVNSLSPASVSAGSPNLRLIIKGEDFVPGAVAEVDESRRETVFISDEQLLVYIPESDLVKRGKRSVTISNPHEPGESNAIQLIVK